MKLSELLGQSDQSGQLSAGSGGQMSIRDAIILKVKNAKTPEEREKWAVYLVKNRYNLNSARV